MKNKTLIGLLAILSVAGLSLMILPVLADAPWSGEEEDEFIPPYYDPKTGEYTPRYENEECDGNGPWWLDPDAEPRGNGGRQGNGQSGGRSGYGCGRRGSS